MQNKKGFTLVELLVVVGIIGILASIGVASLNSARQKARDAKRIADVKQMSVILEAEEGSIPNQPLTGCTGSSFVATTTCTGPGEVAGNFPKLKDASAKAGDGACDTGTLATSKVCNYSILNKAGSGTASTADYQICFNLESGAAGLGKGPNHVESGGLLVAGCGGAALKAAGSACTAATAATCSSGVCKADNTCQ